MTTFVKLTVSPTELDSPIDRKTNPGKLVNQKMYSIESQNKIDHTILLRCSFSYAEVPTVDTIQGAVGTGRIVLTGIDEEFSTPQSFKNTLSS